MLRDWRRERRPNLITKRHRSDSRDSRGRSEERSTKKVRRDSPSERSKTTLSPRDKKKSSSSETREKSTREKSPREKSPREKSPREKSPREKDSRKVMRKTPSPTRQKSNLDLSEVSDIELDANEPSEGPSVRKSKVIKSSEKRGSARTVGIKRKRKTEPKSKEFISDSESEDTCSNSGTSSGSSHTTGSSDTEEDDEKHEEKEESEKQEKRKEVQEEDKATETREKSAEGKKVEQSETSRKDEKAGCSEVRSTASSAQSYTCSGATKHPTERASPICSSSVIYKVGISVKAPTMCELNKAQDEKIVINVGGTRFQTCKSTLKNDPQCIFSKMVCDESEFFLREIIMFLCIS